MGSLSIGYEILVFVVCVGVTLAGGFLGSLAVRNNRVWYDHLNHPVYSPPSWSFSVAWSIIYVLLGISAYLVFREHYTYPVVIAPLVAHLIHLLLNFSWTVIFFELKQIELSIAWLIAIFIMAIATAVLFWRLNVTASCLFIPYLLWLIYAFALNIGIAVLNPGSINRIV